MVELAGIPKKTDEDLMKIVGKTAMEAGITHFDVGQIDDVRKTLTAPIIILPLKKSDRMKFFCQNKFYSLDSKRFVEEHYADNESSQGKTYGSVYLNESLTPQNFVLLKESQKASKSMR